MSNSASIRVTRVVSAIAAGRILNTKTATSQILGGVVWGIGMALHEETLIDHNFGRIVNANIAEYLVPVNADVHDIKVIFVDEPDDSNPLGIKGVGEIGIVGVPRPSPTRSITRPANACATYRLRSTSFWRSVLRFCMSLDLCSSVVSRNSWGGRPATPLDVDRRS